VRERQLRPAAAATQVIPDVPVAGARADARVQLEMPAKAPAEAAAEVRVGPPEQGGVAALVLLGTRPLALAA
jgi:hypothetical protein